MPGGSKGVIVLGAGLAGLSAGYHCGATVYEAAPGCGGTAASIDLNGFVFDLGIHVLQSRNEYFLSLLRDIGVDLATLERSGWIYSYGKYSRYPFQLNTAHLPWAIRARCVAGFLTARPKDPSNYEDWMTQNFGAGFASTFLIPYAWKFWRYPPSEMTFEWTGNRVPKPGVWQIIAGMFWDRKNTLGTNAQFQYPSERGAGFAAIARALAGKAGPIRYDMKATFIDTRSKKVIFNNGRSEAPYTRLISTIPLPDLIRLLPEVPAEVADAAGRLRHNSIAVVNIGVDRASISEKHWVHFPEEDISFFRISFPGNFCEGITPAGASAIQAEVSYDAGRPQDAQDIKNRVCSDLKRVGILRENDRFLCKDVTFIHYGYVIYDHNRRQAVDTIHKYLNGFDIYPCGRYGAWEYLWSDEAVLSGKKAAEAALSA